MPDYKLVRSAKRKTVAIEVHRDQQVVVRVPQHMSKGDIHTLLLSKGEWINQQQQLQAKLPQKPVIDDYSHHSIHFLHGNAVQINYSPVSTIELNGNHLNIPNNYIHNSAEALQPFSTVGKKLKEWYRQEARSFFQQRLQFWLKEIDHWQVSTPKLRLRYMRRYWGSCSSKHWITLNVHLVKLPPTLIDYVITHELCHLRIMNHSRAFYQLQETLLPDWRQHRQAIRAWELKVLP